MKKVIGSKHRTANGEWLDALANIESLVTPEEVGAFAETATERIRSAARGRHAAYAWSGGKDSLCMSSITYDLIIAGEIDPKQLTVIFIDEEGLYPSMVDAAMRWRKKFLSAGAAFIWFCLPFKQVSVIDHLSSTESWITWEPGKEDIWMRQPPPFAVMHSPYLEYPGQMNYQTFCQIAFADGIQMVGLRTSESITRLSCVAHMDTSKLGNCFYPIYDWKDNDVWLYIRERCLEFPEIYMRLYEAGVKKNQLRLCCFFGDMSTQGLRWVAETDHDLWKRIERREPNAYLALLYWDSEMFRRSTEKRQELEADAAPKDYRAMVERLLFKDHSLIPPDTLATIKNWQTLYKKTYGIATNDHYRRMYEALLYGDPKKRVLRITWNNVFRDYRISIEEGDAKEGAAHA